MQGWVLLLWAGVVSHALSSAGNGTAANTKSVLFFCIARNCWMNWMVCSRFLSKILLTTFASTACLRVGKLDKLFSIASCTIARRVCSTLLTRASDMGISWSTGLCTCSAIWTVVAVPPIKRCNWSGLHKQSKPELRRRSLYLKYLEL